MAVIEYGSGGFWVESLTDSVTIVDAAGVQTSSTRTIEKPGIVLGYSICPVAPANNDNVQAIGSITVLEQSGGGIGLGEFITGIRTQIIKQIGTAGNTVITVEIVLFMRGRGRNP